MSRTRKGKKEQGLDWWNKRPLSGWPANVKGAKRICRSIERAWKKKEVYKEIKKLKEEQK